MAATVAISVTIARVPAALGRLRRTGSRVRRRCRHRALLRLATGWILMILRSVIRSGRIIIIVVRRRRTVRRLRRSHILSLIPIPAAVLFERGVVWLLA